MILSTYEEFTMLNSEMITYINELVTNDFNGYEEEEVIKQISEKLNKIEELKFKSDEAIADVSDINNLNELRYSIMNSLFLLSDLLHFYKLREYDRFKMRAINYINHNAKQVYYQ